jgi:hypothetical protein
MGRGNDRNFLYEIPSALITPRRGIIQTPMDKSDEQTREAIKRLEAWGELFYGRNVTRHNQTTLVAKVSALWRRLTGKPDDA